MVAINALSINNVLFYIYTYTYQNTLNQVQSALTQESFQGNLFPGQVFCLKLLSLGTAAFSWTSIGPWKSIVRDNYFLTYRSSSNYDNCVIYTTTLDLENGEPCLDKTVYIKEVKIQLSNTESYQLLTEDPTGTDPGTLVQDPRCVARAALPHCCGGRLPPPRLSCEPQHHLLCSRLHSVSSPQQAKAPVAAMASTGNKRGGGRQAQLILLLAPWLLVPWVRAPLAPWMLALSLSPQQAEVPVVARNSSGCWAGGGGNQTKFLRS